MAIYPYANKTRLVKFLRALGHDIPSIRRAEFSSFHRTYWLAWEDSDGKWHKASYMACAYGPVLIVDRKTTELGMATVRQYGLIEEKKKPLPVRVHRQRLRCGFHHEDNVIIPHPRIFYKRGCELEARSEAGQLGGHSGQSPL